MNDKHKKGIYDAGAIAMGGNPFFVQPRPGRGEKIFKLIKLKTMNNKRDIAGRLLPDEVRLNKYGKFLRATSLDELPELLNILAGHMSIVGEREIIGAAKKNFDFLMVSAA